MSLAVLGFRRQTAVGAVLLTAALIPLGQQLVVFGLHLQFVRLLVLVGFSRILVRQEARNFQTNRLDKLFIAWALTGLICGILRGPTPETFGIAFNNLGVYFLFRFLVKEPEELVGHLRLLIITSIFIGACMVWEVLSRKNLFAVFGGVPEILMERGDRVRCQGPFRIPILAGTFAATLLPLTISLWFQEARNKWYAIFGTLGCTIMTILSNSSGPLLCYVASAGGLMLWPLRNRMRILRRLSVIAIIGLALTMNAPVWYIIARVSDLVGGGGWHRAFIIDLGVNNFSDWWLVGTSRTAPWAPNYQVLLVDPNNIDITNEYVAQAVSGGTLKLGLFLAIIVSGFVTIGRQVRADTEPKLHRKLLWAFGVALASHCMAFFSISYFDQIYVFWFWLLGAISCILSVPSTYTVPRPLSIIHGQPIY